MQLFSCCVCHVSIGPKCRKRLAIGASGEVNRRQAGRLRRPLGTVRHPPVSQDENLYPVRICIWDFGWETIVESETRICNAAPVDSTVIGFGRKWLGVANGPDRFQNFADFSECIQWDRNPPVRLPAYGKRIIGAQIGFSLSWASACPARNAPPADNKSRRLIACFRTSSIRHRDKCLARTSSLRASAMPPPARGLPARGDRPVT